MLGPPFSKRSGCTFRPPLNGRASTAAAGRKRRSVARKSRLAEGRPARAEAFLMNLMPLLARRVEANRPVRAALIGAGKFGSMFLSQVPTIPGLEVAVIADLDPERARAACRAVGWDDARMAATRFVDAGRAACEAEDVEVVIDATGS